MAKVSFDELKRWSERLGIPHHPSEVHGLIAGWICSGANWQQDSARATLAGWLDASIESADFALLEALHSEALAGLEDDDFGFRIKIPDDAAPLNERTRATSQWCSGFLAGFGMTGRYQEQDLNADISEVFADLQQISRVVDEVPDDDENEADLIEIGEYVRMSALLIFTECANKAVH